MEQLSDLFGSVEPKPDPFPIHEMRVISAVPSSYCEDLRTPEEFFSKEYDWFIRDAVDYEVELIHPPECIRDEDGLDCLVGEQYAESSTLPEFLCSYRYPDYTQSFPWVTTYYLRGWTSKFDVPGQPIEYDAGVHVSTVRSDLE